MDAPHRAGTPRRVTAAFSPDAVQAKLSRLRDLLADLEIVGRVDGDALRGDRMLCHAVERVLTQLVETAAEINTYAAARLGSPVPSDYRSSFACAAELGLIPEDLAVRLGPSAGLRNLLVHEYVRADLDIVAGSVGPARRDYAEYVQAVARFLIAGRW